MLKKDKNYTFADFFLVIWSKAPLYFVVNIINKVINSFIPTVQILVIAKLIDSVIEFAHNASYDNVVLFLVVLIALSAYLYLNSALVSLFNSKQEMRFKEKLITEVIEKKASLKFKHVENTETWEVIDRCSDSSGENFILGFNCLLKIIELGAKVFSIFIVIFLHLWWGAFFVLLISIPLIYLAYRSGKTSYDAYKKVNRYKRKCEYLSEVLTERESVDERTLFQYTDKINNMWRSDNAKAVKNMLGVECKNYIKMKGSSIITAVLSFVIIVFLVFSLKADLLTVGLFISLSNQIQSIIHMMSWEMTDLIEDITKLKEFLKDFTLFVNFSESKGVLENSPEIKRDVIKNIEFRHVSFKYPGTNALILKDITLKMEQGKVYAFVGGNGAGKTTIIKLLTGLYDEYTGEILINDKNLKNYTYQEIRNLFSIIYQDFAKYQISIKEILQLGEQTEISVEDMLDSLTFAGFDLSANDDFDVNMSLGKIRKDAVDISGGQWQKLSIAHAALRKAPICVLDEPTASLDPVAESNLYTDYKRVVRGDINILITHRLGAAKIADEIILIDNGQVVGKGCHEYLIKNNSLYANMYDSQKGWYV